MTIATPPKKLQLPLFRHGMAFFATITYHARSFLNRNHKHSGFANQTDDSLSPVSAAKSQTNGMGNVEPVGYVKPPIRGVDKLFFLYADKQSRLIEPEGIEALCSDLGVDHTDVRILMLAWKMQAEKQGYFTLDEWRKAFKALGCDMIITLKEALVKLEAEVRKPSNFEDFYLYAFKYCLTEDRQKTVDIESISVLLDLVLGSQFGPQVKSFVQYLEAQTEYKVMNMDQWMNFYRFCQQVSFPGLENYDPDSGWPGILDDFVDSIKLRAHCAQPVI